MAVTMKTIAQRLGTSISTVSRAASNDPRISEEMRSKIKALMDELGYQPNLMARGLSSKTSRTIGVVLPKPNEQLRMNLFFAEVIRGIMTQTQGCSYDILLITGNNTKEEIQSISAKYKGKRIDGVVLLYSRHNDPVISYLTTNKVPFVLIGRSEQYADIYTTDNDNVQASYDVAQYLLQHGHSNIAIINGPPNMIVSRDRLRGYRQALHEKGIEPRSEWMIDGDSFKPYETLSLLMTLPDKPTAFIVQDDLVALNVISVLEQLGYQVPEHISVISFNKVDLGEVTTPSLTAVDIGIYQLGYLAADVLVRLVEGQKVKQHRTIIPHRIIVRGTTKAIL